MREVRWQARGTALPQLPLVPAAVSDVVSRLRAYFEEGAPLGTLPWELVDQTGWTEFQCRVYRAITEIPHGETRTYGWVAERVRKAGACRAVGQALRNNRLPILVPCHRVVSSASLGGFMGCMDPTQPELRLKRKLIELEESYRSPMFPFPVSA